MNISECFQAFEDKKVLKPQMGVNTQKHADRLLVGLRVEKMFTIH